MNSPETRSLGRIVGGVAPVTIAVQLCSFVSSIALAQVLGASVETDAYFIGLSIPVLVSAVLLAATRAGATPGLAGVASAGDARAFTAAARDLVSATVAAAAVLSAVTSVAAYVVLPAFVPDDPERLLALTRLTIIELAPLGLLGALVGVLGAILGIRGSFAPQIAVMAFEPVVKTVLTFGLGQAIGAQALIIGNLAGSALAAAVLWIVLVRGGVHLRLSRPRRTPFVAAVFAVSLPLVVSQSVLQLNPVVDRAMAAGLGSGSVTSLELGLRLFVVPAALFTAMLIGPITATWSRRFSDDGWPAVQRSITRMIDASLWLLPPVIVLGVLLRHEVIEVMYAGGAVSTHALHETSAVFGVLVLSLPAQMLTIGFSTLFLVHEQTTFPMKVGIANVVLNVALNFALRPGLGVAGIALSTTITLTVLLIAYAVAARRRWGPFYAGSMFGTPLRAGCAAAASFACSSIALAVVPSANGRLGNLMTIAVVAGIGLSAHLAVFAVLRRRPLHAVPAYQPSVSSAQ